MDLNHLKAKLFKAEMSENQELIEEYTRLIKEYERDHADEPQPWQTRDREGRREERRDEIMHPDDEYELNQMKNELNLLNSKKIKAEMLEQIKLCNEYQAKIEEHQRRMDEFKSKVRYIERSARASNESQDAEWPPGRYDSPNAERPSGRYDSSNADRPPRRYDSPNADRPPRRYDTPNSEWSSRRNDTPNSDRSSRRYDTPNTDRSTSSSNSVYSEKQRKAREDYSSKLLEQCKREVEELRSRQQGMPRMFVTNPKKQESMDELNVLNERLRKAQMIRDERKITELKARIQEVREREAEIEKEDDERNLKEEEEEKRKVDQLNKLSAKLLKAEMMDDQNMIEDCKREIDEFTRAMEAEKVETDRKQAEPDFDFIEVFERLVQANKVNDKRQIDACKTQIHQFEQTFNFKHKGDLEKLADLSGAALEETMKVKAQEEMDGNLAFANDLDKRAKAIRKKNIEYKARLEEVIAAEPIKERVVKSRVHPLYGPPPETSNAKQEVKHERGVPKTERSAPERTVRVIRKFQEEHMSLQQMFVSEKNAGKDSEDARFMSTSSRVRGVDDEYEETASKRRKKNDHERTRLEEEEEEKCDWCLERVKERLLIDYNEKVYMLIAEKEPMLENQLIIRSTDHSASLVAASEDVVEAVNQCKQKLCAVFGSIDQKLIFVEYHLKHQSRWNKHFELFCYPIDENSLESSKMFFMKGINDVGSEWDINKKLISLNGEPISKKVPKELSYFCVTFGASNEGFAHVIEDRQRFKRYFGEEIIGGMLDIDPQKWLNPALQHYEQQEARSAALKKLWNKFDVSTK